MLGEIQKSAAPPVAPGIFFSESFADELIRLCLDALPHKAFGLVGGTDIYCPQSLYPCSTNLRNEPEWKALFESFGEFYRNPDLGFVIAASEVQTVMEAMVLRHEQFVGVFHSHRYLSVHPSEVDIALNSDPGLLSYIVSVANPSAPEMGVFRLNGGGYQNIPIIRKLS
jgi:[CysO sulfur-carrier protein]-S-L-cysteine hydrolase